MWTLTQKHTGCFAFRLAPYNPPMTDSTGNNTPHKGKLRTAIDVVQPSKPEHALPVSHHHSWLHTRRAAVLSERPKHWLEVGGWEAAQQPRGEAGGSGGGGFLLGLQQRSKGVWRLVQSAQAPAGRGGGRERGGGGGMRWGRGKKDAARPKQVVRFNRWRA